MHECIKKRTKRSSEIVANNGSYILSPSFNYLISSYLFQSLFHYLVLSLPPSFSLLSLSLLVLISSLWKYGTRAPFHLHLIKMCDRKRKAESQSQDNRQLTSRLPSSSCHYFLSLSLFSLLLLQTNKGTGAQWLSVIPITMEQ